MLLLADGQALLGRQAVDGALGVEDGVDPPHRLDRERRLGEIGQLEEVAPCRAPSTPPRIGPGLRAAR